MIEAILTDIEGTTSSISFVHDVLFPYARARMDGFVREHVDDPQVVQQLEAVRALSEYPGDLGGDIQQLLAWIDQDKKVTPLKALQGMIWEQGYRDGDFHGHVYDDAFENLRLWYDQGIALYVYSSGSVHAQKLLFGHTCYGDLTPLFSGYFDTRIGAKVDPASYANILAETHVPAARMLFLSDVVAELDAARAAGIKTACLQRETVLRDVGHPVFADFNGIDLAVLGG